MTISEYVLSVLFDLKGGLRDMCASSFLSLIVGSFLSFKVGMSFTHPYIPKRSYADYYFKDSLLLLWHSGVRFISLYRSLIDQISNHRVSRIIRADLISV